MPPVDVSLAARALVERWFPEQPVTLERMGAGVSTPVYRVTIGDETSYLRLGEKPGERRDAEVRVHELARNLGIDVPEILRWEREPPELDRSAALTSRIPGIPLGEYTGHPAPDLQQQAGRDLARINAIPVRGYGWVTTVEGTDRHLVAEHPTRAAWASEYLAAMHTVIAASALSDHLHTALEDAVRGWASLPGQETSCLAHGDFDVSHIYVDPDTGAWQGLIDFGEIRGTDPFYDLGHLLVCVDDVRSRLALDTVNAGYAEIAPVDPAAIRVQAIAIATRALAIQLGRTSPAYRDFLRMRLATLLDAER